VLHFRFEAAEPFAEFALPPALANQASPPTRGHGITIAAYDEVGQTGLLRWLGIITGGVGTTRTVDWQPTTAQIWVDTGTGRGFWRAGPFAFAPKKVCDYGLHELWQQHFNGLELRDRAAMRTRPQGIDDPAKPDSPRAAESGRSHRPADCRRNGWRRVRAEVSLRLQDR